MPTSPAPGVVSATPGAGLPEPELSMIRKILEVIGLAKLIKYLRRKDNPPPPEDVRI